MQASPRTRGRLSLLVSLVLAFTGLQAFMLASPVQANPGGTDLVIREVYGGGGSASATASYKTDFVELYNPTNAPISVNGRSLQYRAATFTTGGGVSVLALPNKVVPANDSFLVEVSGPNATPAGGDLPPTDFSSTALNMAQAAGQVLLVEGTTPVTAIGDLSATPTVIDMVGYGTTPTSFETARTNAATSITTSASRNATGADTNNNSTDFLAPATPTPTAATGSTAPGSGPLAATNPGNQTFTQNQAITPFTMAATGGTPGYTWSDPGNTLPAGLSINAAGQVSGTPTGTGTTNVSLTVTDSTSATASTSFQITVNAPGALAATNPGNKTFTQNQAITPFTMAATGGTPPYTWSDPTNSLPAGLSINAAGQVSGTPTGTGTTNVSLTVTDSVPASASTSFQITVNAPGAAIPISQIQGTGERSSFAPASGNAVGTVDVTTEGVVTAVNKRGFASSGTPSAATCGFCGFTIQTGGTGGSAKAPGAASDAVFVYGGTAWLGKNSVNGDIAVGDSVRVTGKVSEFSASGTPADTGSFTEINLPTTSTAATAAAVVPVTPALAPITKRTVLPATYAERESFESELFAPTDVVLTDHFNFQTFGEFGLATGNTPLVQPTEVCEDDDTACLAAAKADIKNRGWFTEDGTSTSYLTSSNFYRPYLSPNSDIPLPFINKTKSARIGAKVTWPQGGTLDYRNKKWYVMPPRAVLSTHGGTPDLGTDVLDIENTRPANLAPAAVPGDLKVATYNVENYFITTMQSFATANPYYTCDYDYDRLQQPVLAFQCTAPHAIPSAFDPITGAPTAYTSGLVSAPRGAARQQDLDRQTSKIVTAINALDADVISLEELSNPNKLRMGVTNSPLNPDPNKADSGLGTPIAWRDEAIAYLVGKLNDASTAGKWNFVASPEETTDATPVNHMCATVNPDGSTVQPPQTNGTCSWASGQDVIRSGFLYKTATVVPVGQSDLDLPNSSAPVPSPFDNAREPLAQYFKPVGHPNSDGFAVIANHFKSKGNSDPAATGGNANDANVGAFNLSRTEQAKELLRFASEFAAKWNTNRVFLVGDFNSYTKEDPIQAILHDPLNTLGFTQVASSDPNDTTYIFSHTLDTGVGYGAKGSLDHVFASAGLQSAIQGADIWEINGNEPGVYNYGRYNTNITDFWDDTTPFGGSDHNPAIVGFNVPNSGSVRDVQIIGSNDFHGRLVASSSDGGAAQLAGAVKSLKRTWGADNSTFVAAGDLIGASTFESFIDKDKPTLKALNAAGLEYSSVGNHEFDQGVGDLVDRVMKPYNASTNPDGIPGGLDWQYLASNVKWTTDPDGAGPINVGDTIAPPIALKTMPGGGVDGGIKIGFIGAVTEDLPNLVAPSALNGVSVSPIASASNQAALTLVAQGADVIVLLVHEGAPSTDCSTMTTGSGAFAELLGDLAPNIDAVISGHTHLEYACEFAVPEWSSKPIKKRPVVSAGQYGVALDQLVYSFDNATGEPVEVTVNNVGVKGPGSTLFSYPEDAAVKQIVDDAVAAAAAPGAVVLGKIAGPFKRARLSGGVTENRGGESTLGNLVAEIQRAETPAGGPIAAAQIAFMNPGGLRDDMLGTGAAFPKDVTYKQAAAVQPFANTLVNMDMTGAQIKAVLEQQWQRDPQGNVPSRPFLRLGTSKGFTYNYTETTETTGPAAGAKKGTVTSMWLNGQRVTMGGVYSVTMNSFLASGGDNFAAFLGGADKRDTGVTDLQAQVDYFAENASPTPLPVDYGQHAVRVTFVGSPPAEYGEGDTVAFNLASLAMTGVDDVKDTTLKVTLNGQDVATGIPVTNTIGSTPDDEAGTASVSFNLPAGVPGGEQKLHVIGNNTGTDFIVPIQVESVEPATRDIQILATNDFHGRIQNDPASASAGAAVMAGAVKQLRTANPDTVFAAAGDLIGASTFESFIDKDKPTIDALNAAGLDVSSVGNHEFDQGYNDLVNRVMAAYNSTSNPKGGAEWQYLGANVRFKANNNPALPSTWTKDFGDVRVGFVGTVTEHLPELVSPGGIADIKVTDIVAETNAAADDLKNNQGADLVIMLVHEGAPGTNCASIGALGADTDFGKIVQGVNANVDAIVSGHTHLLYNCSFPVAAWSGRPVTERPVVSSGQYGTNLNRLVFTVDTATGEVQAKTQSVLPLKSCANSTACTNYPADGPTATIVSAAVSNAAVLGAQPLGQLAGPFNRGKSGDSQDNRGAESTVGNLVAEIQRWATRNPESGSAQIAFMNPGGLRADMVGSGTGAYPRTLTYQQAAEVQPFANTLVNMKLTGAQIKTVLEQQWQPTGAARPFLKLGISKGFTYTYDPDAATGSHIKQMWLDGTPIASGTTYSVTVNSFLSTGGDNFLELNNGTQKQDTGKTDLQAQVDYMAEFASSTPLAVDYNQRAVGIKFPTGAPASYAPGDSVAFNVSSWSFTAATDAKDTAVVVKLGSTTLGTFPLDNAIQATLPGFDEVGKAAVDVVIPAGTPGGTATLTLEGATTGTSTTVPVAIKPTPVVSAPDVTTELGTDSQVTVTVDSGATGTVEVKEGATLLGSGTLSGGSVTIDIDSSDLAAGVHNLDANYLGDATNASATGAFTLTVTKKAANLNVANAAMTYGKSVQVTATLAPTATGTVMIKSGALVLGSAAASGGQAKITIPAKSLTPGAKGLTAEYAGDGTFAAETDTFTVNVAKAASSVKIKINPKKIKKGVTKAKVKITVSSTGVVPTGKVKVKVKGMKAVTTDLGNLGKAVVKLKAFGSLGKKKVKVTYLGSSLVNKSSAKKTIKVIV